MRRARFLVRSPRPSAARSANEGSPKPRVASRAPASPAPRTRDHQRTPSHTPSQQATRPQASDSSLEARPAIDAAAELASDEQQDVRRRRTRKPGAGAAALLTRATNGARGARAWDPGDSRAPEPTQVSPRCPHAICSLRHKQERMLARFPFGATWRSLSAAAHRSLRERLQRRTAQKPRRCRTGDGN